MTQFSSINTAFDRIAVPTIVVLRAGLGLPGLCGAMRRQGLIAHEVADDRAALDLLGEVARPDLLILNLAAASGPLLQQLTAAVLAGTAPAVIAVADAGSADLAGSILLGRAIHFVAPGADEAEIEAALAAALAGYRGYAVGEQPQPDLMSVGALSREVERIAAALAALAAREGGGAPPRRTVTAATVRGIIKARRARARFFPADLFSDPAWDMLLDLAAARLEGRCVSVSSLCIAAAVPTTTALRWIRNLCDVGVFERRTDPGDARRAFIVLSDATAEAMLAYLETLSGCPPV